MMNLLHYIVFLKQVKNNEFCLNDDEAAEVLGCATSSLGNLRSKGELVMNVDYIHTFGSGFFYRQQSLLSRLASKSWKAQKR